MNEPKRNENKAGQLAQYDNLPCVNCEHRWLPYHFNAKEESWCYMFREKPPMVLGTCTQHKPEYNS